MGDDDPIEILSCPSCGGADLDFEWRSKTLMRCGLCNSFVEITEVKDWPAQGEGDTHVIGYIGRPFAPQPPTRVKIVPR
jgi:hypothetical protein